MTAHYSIKHFISDAKCILSKGLPLEVQKQQVGERLRELAKRDDLLSFGRPIGYTDASNFNWVLYREHPDIMLVMVGWLPGYRSPIHEHADYYPIGVGYRGHDRWDIYERKDDGKTPGYADLELIDQWHVTPGKLVYLAPPPQAIHSHNMLSMDMTYELLFFSTPSLTPEQRLHFDPDEKRCWPTHFSMDVFDGEWPPQSAPSTVVGNSNFIQKTKKSMFQQVFCPLCSYLPRLWPQAVY